MKENLLKPLTILSNGYFAIVVILSVISHFYATPVSSIPSFLTDKKNFLNLYFVKLGWAWTSAPVLLLMIISSSMSPNSASSWLMLRRSLSRWALASAYWIVFTQWFFGLSIFDKMFHAWPYAICVQNPSISAFSLCKSAGFQWSTFDASGHCFLLIHSSMFIWAELSLHMPQEGRLQKILPAISTRHQLIRLLNYVLLAVAFLWFIMLASTSIYFHKLEEKIVGAFIGWLFFAMTLPIAQAILTRGVAVSAFATNKNKMDDSEAKDVRSTVQLVEDPKATLESKDDMSAPPAPGPIANGMVKSESEATIAVPEKEKDGAEKTNETEDLPEMVNDSDEKKNDVPEQATNSEKIDPVKKAEEKIAPETIVSESILSPDGETDALIAKEAEKPESKSVESTKISLNKSKPAADAVIGAESDESPLKRRGDTLTESFHSEANEDSESISLLKIDKTDHTKSKNDTTTVTMVDGTAPERLNPTTGDPEEVDHALDPPKFNVAEKSEHIASLTKVLKLDHTKMSRKQKEAAKGYVSELSAFYTPMSVFKDATHIHHDAALLDLVFETIPDDKHPSADKLYSLLVILSRYSKTKHPNGGAEPRVVKIIEVLKSHSTSSETSKEAVRALINYAEVNAKLILDNGGIEALLTHFTSHMQETSFQIPLIWLVRNLTVPDVCRKPVMDKMGFLIVNSLNAHQSDVQLVENACWTLGNLAVSDENASLLLAIGALTACKTSLVTHIDKDKVVEAAAWFFYNATYDRICQPVSIPIEEHLIQALKRHPSNKNIIEWVDATVKRMRALVQSNTPHAIAERNANKIIKDGNLLVQSTILKRWKKKFVSLQPSRLVCSSSKEDPEIDEEIRLRDVCDVMVDKETTKLRLITRTRTMLIDCLDQKEAALWLTEFKTAWKLAVSAVYETPISPADPPASPTGRFGGGSPFNFSVPETVALKDVEKVVAAQFLHEIYHHPNFVMMNFKSQKTTKVSVWDFAVATLGKKLTDEFLDKRLKEFKVGEKDAYEIEKMKHEVAKIIDERLMQEVAEFEKDPKFDAAPEVLTRYEYCAKQGIRPTMEDRHIHLPYIDTLVGRKNKEEPVSYYAVYDGHGGINVAAFVEIHLHQNIMRHPYFDIDIKKAISESFMQTQEELKEFNERNFQMPVAGSTSVVILFRGKKMYVAWAGDSLASLFRVRKDIELVDGHKPTKASEKARIEMLGGFVGEEGGVMRVNGAVAVSRAFGNVRHKVIIPEPDIVEHELYGDEEYIVLACDGLWDVMTSAQVRKFVKKYMSKHGNKTTGMSEALVDEALKLGSTDNVSVIFIEFNSWKEPKRTY